METTSWPAPWLCVALSFSQPWGLVLRTDRFVAASRLPRLRLLGTEKFHRLGGSACLLFLAAGVEGSGGESPGAGDTSSGTGQGSGSRSGQGSSPALSGRSPRRASPR